MNSKVADDKQDDFKMRQAWGQHFSEEWMLGMGTIPPGYLQKVRIMLLIAFKLKRVDIECDQRRYKMKFEVWFKWWQLKGKEKKLGRILGILQERFPDYEVELYRM